MQYNDIISSLESLLNDYIKIERNIIHSVIENTDWEQMIEEKWQEIIILLTSYSITKDIIKKAVKQSQSRRAVLLSFASILYDSSLSSGEASWILEFIKDGITSKNPNTRYYALWGLANSKMIKIVEDLSEVFIDLLWTEKDVSNTNQILCIITVTQNINFIRALTEIIHNSWYSYDSLLIDERISIIWFLSIKVSIGNITPEFIWILKRCFENAEKIAMAMILSNRQSKSEIHTQTEYLLALIAGKLVRGWCHHYEDILKKLLYSKDHMTAYRSAQALRDIHNLDISMEDIPIFLDTIKWKFPKESNFLLKILGR